MRKELNLGMILSLATLLFSAGISWGIVQSKTQEFDKAKDKIEDNDKKIIAIEVKLEDIKDTTKEIRSDLKDILKKL